MEDTACISYMLDPHSSYNIFSIYNTQTTSMIQRKFENYTKIQRFGTNIIWNSL